MSAETQLPYDAQAERSLIASVLREPDKFPELAQVVRPEDFYSFAMRRMWECFGVLQRENAPIDPVTVGHRLHGLQQTEEIGGIRTIIELWESAPAAPNSEAYARLIANKAKLRRLILQAKKIVELAEEPQADATDVAGKIEAALLDATRARPESALISLNDAVLMALESLDRRRKQRSPDDFTDSLMTGWPALDEMLAGWHRKELIVIAARPSVGKTLFAVNAIDSLATRGAKIMFASLEQTATEVAERILCRRGPIDSWRMRAGVINEMEVEAILHSARDLRSHPVWINDCSGQTVMDIYAQARRLKLKHGLDAVFVDYLQRVEPEDRRANRQEQVAGISMRLAAMAKDLDVPVIALAQLNRQKEQRGPDSPPRLSDLKESGQIEQDAYTVLGLHKPEEPDKNRQDDQLEVHCLKQRNGPLGVTTLLHRKAYFQILDPIDMVPGEVPA